MQLTDRTTVAKVPLTGLSSERLEVAADHLRQDARDDV
jgi:hypothetical protein